MPTHKVHSKYAAVGNDVLQSDQITLKAKGLLAYLISKPEGWDFAAKRMEKELLESYPTLLKILAELEGCRLLRREKLPNGKVLYHVFSSWELLEKPELNNATVKECHSGISLPISNKDKYKVKKRNIISEFETYEKLISFWNQEHGKRYKPTLTEKNKNNIRLRLEQYSEDEIKAAILIYPHHPFWHDKMSPELMFRQYDRAGNPVDYIGDLLNDPSQSSYVLEIRQALRQKESRA